MSGVGRPASTAARAFLTSRLATSRVTRSLNRFTTRRASRAYTAAVCPLPTREPTSIRYSVRGAGVKMVASVRDALIADGDYVPRSAQFDRRFAPLSRHESEFCSIPSQSRVTKGGSPGAAIRKISITEERPFPCPNMGCGNARGSSTVRIVNSVRTGAVTTAKPSSAFRQSPKRSDIARSLRIPIAGHLDSWPGPAGR